MLKKWLLALSIIAGAILPAYSAGTISLSLSQQFDSQGKPLSGGRLYFFQAGTTTPQNAFQDTGLTLPLPNPIVLDSAGRVPQFFLADGNIKIRLESSAGVTQVAADGILVIGASSGGGGGSPVDATTILATGDLKARYGTGTLSGFVRANGRTIGSATSGATERANADTQALFQYLWDADVNLVVSSGRGASAAADWSANKTIALPDWRGRALAFLDDMGSSAAGRLSATWFGTAATVLGAAGGSQSHLLTAAQTPVLTGTGVTNTAGAHQHTFVGGDNTTVAPSGDIDVMRQQGSRSTSSTGDHSHTVTVTVNSGGGLAHPIVQPTMLATIYLKL